MNPYAGGARARDDSAEPFPAAVVSSQADRAPQPVPGDATVGEVMAEEPLHISDDAAIDQAMDILRASGTDRLLVRTETGRCGGLLTSRHLDAYREDVWYDETLRVGQIPYDSGPFARASTPVAVALADMRARGLAAAPVVDEEGRAVGVVTTADLVTALATPADTRSPGTPPPPA